MVCFLKILVNLLWSYGNVLFTLLLTIDRLIYITRPLHYNMIVTPRRALLATFVTWLAIFAHVGLMMGVHPTLDARNPCRWGNVVNRVAFYLSLGLFVVITFGIMVPIYGVIGFIAWKLERTEPDLSNFPPENQEQQKRKLKERKMVKTIGLVFGAYLACYID